MIYIEATSELRKEVAMTQSPSGCNSGCRNRFAGFDADDNVAATSVASILA